MAARLVVLGLLVAGCQCWETPAVNQGRRAQYYLQQNDNSYHYGFDTAEGLYQTQQGDQANEVHGQFGADGGKVEYTAGVGGFVVTALQKPDATATKIYAYKAPVRYATLEELATHPKQVDDTAEVKAAKVSFQAAYDAAAAAAAAAPDFNIISEYAPAVPVNTETYSAPATQVYYQAPASVEIQYSGPSAPLDASGSVVDTPEVKAAKASFQAAYDTAAAAAAAAPDVNIITGYAPAVPVNTDTYSAPATQAYYQTSAPVEIQYSGPSAPLDASGSVDDTPEVKAAKASFQAAYDTAAAAAAAAPDVNIITGYAPAVSVNTDTYSAPATQAYYQTSAPVEINFSGPGAPLDASGRVDDTAEVKAAKATFQTAYDAAAAAAAAAPDFNIISEFAPAMPVNTETYSAPATQAYYQAAAPVEINYSGPSAPLDASGSVDDTAEVKAAKATFQAAYDAAAAAAAAAPDDDIITGYAPAVSVNTETYSAPATQAYYQAVAPVEIQYSGPSVSLDASGRVDDTAEVKAAKAAFQAAYDAAAAAAAAAPDNDIITGYGPAAPVNTQTYSAQAPQTSYQTSAPVEVNYAGPGAPLDVSGRVDDTAEVKAAKVAFQAAFDAAAAAAAAAPDNDIITASVHAPATGYSVPVSQTSYSASHGNMRTISFDGITLMQAEGPAKFGYSYEKTSHY